MAAIDELTELVERAAAAEKVAVSSRWKERPDVVAMITRVRRTAREQRDELTRDGDLGNATVPAILIIISSTAMWILLTVLAVALSQQPRIRRILQREITDYKANAEMKAYEQEAAARAAAENQARTAADTGPN